MTEGRIQNFSRYDWADYGAAAKHISEDDDEEGSEGIAGIDGAFNS